MDRPFYVSRCTVRILRRRVPPCRDVAYTIPLSRSQKDERTKDQAPFPGCDIDGSICKNGSVLAFQAKHSTSRPHILALYEGQKRLKHPNVVAQLKNWTPRHYNHCLITNEDGRVSDPSLMRGLLSRSRCHTLSLQFNQVLGTVSVCSSRISGRRRARNFTTNSAFSVMLDREDQPLFQDPKSWLKTSTIRDRLQLWETENQVLRSLESQFEPPPAEIALAEYQRQTTFDEEGLAHDSEYCPYPVYERGDIVDLESQRPYLLRGDMVELRNSDSSLIELAVFIRTIGTQHQYYSMSGRWMHQSVRMAKYCVPNFVDASELASLLAFLPPKSVPEILQNRLQNFAYALPREIGSTAIRRMLHFWRESERIYRDTAFQVDTAHKRVAHHFNVRHASLSDIADELLPKGYRKDGQFPAPVLYALHRSLMLDELGFRPQRWNHRISNRFAITPISEVALIRAVGLEIRGYQKHLGDCVRGSPEVKNAYIAKFLKFLRKASRKINQSRRTREYTSHGAIGPLSRRDVDDVNAENNGGLDFDNEDQRYVRFIAYWAGLRTIQNHSWLHGAASALLRSTGMYQDTVLDQRVGWTFLQEIGAIAPWENVAHFDMRLSSALNLTRVPLEVERQKRPDMGHDVLDGLRKDWGDMPVYCIDDVDASDIDDGVSVEPADVAGEYWVHVHVADPASMIEPESGIAQDAMSAVRTSYLPDRVVPMLPGDVVQGHLSLASGRRCLTFSGRINLAGKLLDTKVTAGVLQNIIYLTPATLSTILGEDALVYETVQMVGEIAHPQSIKSSRKVVDGHEITDLDEKNLRLLHTLGETREALSSAKGSLMFSSSSFRVAAVINDDFAKYEKTQYNHQSSTDPWIDLRVERRDQDRNSTHGHTVMNLMLLAGEVGARWCQERGIPVINRVSQPHPDDPDPREFFRRVILPILNHSDEVRDEVKSSSRDIKYHSEPPGENNGSSQPPAGNVAAPAASNASKTLPLNIALEYQRVLGAVVPSTSPGPHLHLGLDMFARVTSPLRRFSDLVVHWQIEAALLEEARLGRSLIGNTAEDFLPFKRDKLDSLIPVIDGRERELNSQQRDVQRVWAMQLLLRAWKFHEAPLPATFEFWAHTMRNKLVRGGLTYFGGLSATFDRPDWLQEGEVEPGDVFEVELSDLDIYNKRIMVKPLRLLRRTTERTI